MANDSEVFTKEYKQERLIKSLTEEKLKSQERRSSFNIRKLIFVAGLFSVGVVKLPYELDLKLVLYIVPVISICFDLYILGEDYGIKRIGRYIENKFSSEPEGEWEKWVGFRKDPFAKYAVPILSLIVLIACASILLRSVQNIYFFYLWIILNISAIIFNLIYSQWLQSKLLEDDKTVNLITR
jgi:hypothetical protein